jgi:glycerate 2-kinase
MKILIAPNSFKGSLSSLEACQSIARGLSKSGLSAEYVLFPIADGGDGTLEAFLQHGGTRHTVASVDALMRPIEADYGMLLDGKTAIIEMALSSGIARSNPSEISSHSALHASTYGTGLLMQHALEQGAQRFIIGLGGSASTDGGVGCLQALGVRFLNADGQDLAPGGGALHALQRIDSQHLDPRWRQVEVIIASDVQNVALGEHGAAHVFAPQKGATAQDAQQLDHNLTHYFNLLQQHLGVDVRHVNGSGAAGAFGGGLLAFLGADIRSGVNLIMDFCGFDAQVQEASLVITGEGRFDSQTLDGKAPQGIAERALKWGVPTAAFAGGIAIDPLRLQQAGIMATFPLTLYPMSLADAIANAPHLLEEAAVLAGQWLQVGLK